MEDLVRTMGSATGRAVMAAVPLVVGAAVTEPLLLGAMAGAGMFAAGVVLTVGVGVAVVWAVWAMR